jgi:hypothetical protein
LALDTSVLDSDQVENLIKFCPTKEEIEMLKVAVPNALWSLWSVLIFVELVHCVVFFLS